MANLKLSDVLPLLKNVRQTSSGYTSRCPSHDDNKNSLSVKEGDRGKMIFHCFAGCSYQDIAAALNLSTNGNGQNPAKRIEAIYEYTDEEGNLLYQNVRFEGKDFRWRRFDKDGKEIWNLDGVRRVPYRLTELLKMPAYNDLVMAEGEKDADTLTANGLIATNHKNWRAEFNYLLKGRRVIIFQDHDKAGVEFAEKAAQMIRHDAKAVRVVDCFGNEPLPSKHGKDVSDYFVTRSLPELLELCRQTPDFQSQKEFSEQKEILADESLALPVLSNAALYGLAGEIIRTIEPHTEADNAALLVQLLAGFGCLIGKTAYFRTEADYHYMKLFAVLVGASSKGRKGTSWGQIKRLQCRVDESFKDCVQDGLSSGEGLIFHVRDAQSKKVPIREKGRIVDYQEEIVDEGATEKRAFVVEPEFARVLSAMKREGNTLSSIIRQAWDSDRLRIMTKNPIRASEAHISIVGHITKDELLRNLDETETANGFANRFLWCFIRRSKYLPEGGNLSESELNHLVEKMNKAVMYARATCELKRDESARRKWIEIYPKLSDGHTGLFGSVTSRAEAQVMRLACLYALLDCAEEIQLEHLEAALALWQYCEDSARYIFGNQTGNKTADTIYAALLGAEDGLTKTQIRDLLQRNASASQVNTALKLLIELGRIEVTKEETDGRPRENYQTRRYDQNDINDKSINVPP
jgi:5S rRNA maturation endonuclease (ribonuclease M5)